MESNNQLQTLGSITALVEKNDAVIEDKVTKALAALSVVKVIENKEWDDYANNVLVKCNDALNIIEGLRKEYTAPLDAWKKSKMERENKLKDEMSRVKKERDAYKNREQQEANAKRLEIEKKQKHDQHLAEIKNELIASVELTLAEKITKGENAISAMFGKAVLENVDQLAGKLSFEPKLDEALLRSSIDDFDKPRKSTDEQGNEITLEPLKIDYSIVSKEEIDDLKARAHKKFNHAFMSTKYIELVKEIQDKWKAKIPERKASLERLAKASAEDAERIKKEQADKARREKEEIDRKRKEDLEAIEKKKNESNTEAITKTTFDAQVQSQNVEDQDGARKKVIFRFTDEKKIIDNPLEFVNIMSSVMAHVATDKDWLGPFKRDQKTKFPKKDPDTGEVLYDDMVQAWLDWIASIKPTPTIPGLTATERLSSVAKRGK